MLGIQPTSRGFGYVVFEGSTRLIDWGTHGSSAVGKNDRLLAQIELLLSRYQPDTLVTERTWTGTSRRSPRVRQLVAEIRRLTGRHLAACAGVTSEQVAQLFADRVQAVNKHEIARAIAEIYPELKPRVPPPRKVWMSQDERTGIFDAAAFALAYYFEQPEAPAS